MHPSPAPTANLTIEVEDAGHSSVLHSVLTTLSGQSGTQASRFVGRATQASEEAAVVATSSTFPVSPLALVDGPEDAPDGGWPDEARVALDELDTTLVAQGWECTATGRAGGNAATPVRTADRGTVRPVAGGGLRCPAGVPRGLNPDPDARTVGTAPDTR